MTKRCAAGILALLCFPALDAAAATGSSGAEASAAKSPPRAASKALPVLQPRRRQRIRTHPVKIVVRAGDGLFDLRARLNGRWISHSFGKTRNGRRSAHVSRSHGLRRGRNVLWVRVKRPNGKVRKRRFRFFVVHGRPLAGAGRDRRVATGSPVKHQGRALPSPGKSSRGRRHHRLRYRWLLLRAPRRSAYRKHARRGARIGAAAALSDPTARRPRFKPDAPGRYVFRLRVGDARGATTDRVVISAAPRQWLVPVDTMASGDFGALGVRVGSEFYTGFDPLSGETGCGPDTPAGACLPWMQVVVLDRRTLGFVSNEVYACDAAISVCPINRIRSDLAKLNDTKLVIAASQPEFLPAAPVWSQILGRIGAPSQGEETSPGGLISVVGVPGMKPGAADVKYATDQAQVGEGMVGYLTPDQHLNFGWAPGDRVPFDTRAVVESSAPGGLRNVIEVGEQRFEQALPGDAQGGFGVVVLDRFTLALRARQAFSVFDQASAGDNGASMAAMAAFLRTHVRSGDIVLVSSIGRSSVQAGPWEVLPGWSELAGEIQSLGGTRHVFNSSLLRAAPYALVGWGGAGATRGEEASPVVLSRQAEARIRGSLTTDRRSQFKPRGTSPFSAPNDALVREVLKPPTTAWPLDDDPGTRAALSYLGSLDNRLGPDPRTAYVNDLDWDTLTGKVRAAKYPGSRKFSQADFNTAQQRLIAEMGWVANVRKYLGNLSQPFDGDNLSGWAQLQKTARSIQDAANVKPDRKAESLILDIVGGVLEVAAIAIPESAAVAAVVVEVIAVSYDTALEYWTQNPDGSSDDTVIDRAANLGVDLAGRFMEAKSAFDNMGNVIVTDPAKLQTVGTLANCNPDRNPNCPAAWAWTPDAKAHGSVSLLLGLERSFYESLLPLAFPAYAIQPEATGSEEEDDASVDFRNPPAIGKYYCGDVGRNFPFRDEPARGATSLLQLEYHRDAPNAADTYFYYALGAPKITATAPTPAKPPATITQRMFAPIDPGGDPNVGGLGIYPPYFMLNANVRNYGPNDPFGSNCAWLQD